jgi:hypothetical protein
MTRSDTLAPMSGRWKPPKSERTDAEILRRKKELAEKLAFEVEDGTEEEFVAAVKKFKPDVSKEELKAWIIRFHDARRERALALSMILSNSFSAFWNSSGDMRSRASSTRL